MREININIELPEKRRVLINGGEFEIMVDDVRLLELADGLLNDFRGVSVGAEDVLETLKKAVSVIDVILGEGAMKRILGGRSVGCAFMLERVVAPVLKNVLCAASESVAGIVAEEYAEV